uniref:Cyclin-Q n=1 Tax=Phallusia mammillata TaxID=59560 RepID=A0A6F9DCF9_9ASCI|nr:cyclin-related protein FAM58A-like [Phallusia mammillata]
MQSEEKFRYEEHFKTSKFICKCAIKLRLSDTTLASACVLYHRFFKHCSTTEYDTYTVASTAIYLATKIEEEHMRLRDVVNVCHRTKHPQSKHLEFNAEFWDLRDTIAACELLMLRVLKFDVTYIHPHKYMLHYLMSLSNLFHRRVWETNPISDVAWAILKDSYLANSCLDFCPQVHAIAAIDLAIQSCKVEVPLSNKAETVWWKALYNNCTKETLAHVKNEIVEVYDISSDVH